MSQGYEQLKSNLRDVAFTTTTPFGADGRDVRYEPLRANVRSLYDAGGRCFLPCGNTAEYYSLTDQERIEVVRNTVEAVPSDATVVAGAGGSTRTIQSLSEAYEAAGADAVMIMHPVHTYVHERGLYRHYEQITDSTDLGLVLYKRGPKLPDDVVSRLTEVDNVVGVKYAVDDVEAFSRLQRRAGGDVTWLTGNAERFAPAFAFEGAEGFTTGIGNFVPEHSLALHDALRGREWDRSKRIRDRLRPYEELRDECGEDNDQFAANNVPAVKYGMDLAGLYGGPVRAPLSPLSRQDEQRAERYYDRITSEEPDARME